MVCISANAFSVGKLTVASFELCLTQLRSDLQSECTNIMLLNSAAPALS